MPRLRVTTDASSLAVALGNALAFLPARSLIPYVAVRITTDAIRTCGTDSYAAGTDIAPVTGFVGSEPEWICLFDKEGLTQLERCAREAKKVEVILTVEDGSVTISPMGLPEASALDHSDGHAAIVDMHLAVWDIIDAAEKRVNVMPPGIMLDPTLFGRFAKVKADKAERKADLLFSADHEPVLIKIGPTFKGLIMPIDREVNSTNVGSDGLW